MRRGMLASICTLFKSGFQPFASRPMSTRSYQEAIEKLNSLQSNAATLEAIKQSGNRKSESTIAEMVEYLGRIGYKPDDLNKLNVIHVTGTKGKGSTCAFTDSILRQAAPDWKVGLYTSPHLVAVRERIRLNGVPISEEDFAKYFFEVWDKLEQNQARVNPSTLLKPMYFRFLTLVAFHYFSSVKVDATVLEVGVGGKYDCTNVVPKPIVTGVTSLGLDHVTVLGKTLQEIAWQKGGIYKPGVPAFTVEQPAEAMEALKQRAIDAQASTFTVVPPLPEVSTIKLGLSGIHQKQNATLALHLAHHFLLEKQELDLKSPRPSIYPVPLAQEVKAGLELARWPGRCQQVQDPASQGLTWFLDGAHTVESLNCCAEWFFSRDVGLRDSSSPRTRVLIFNCTHGRSGSQLLGALLNVMKSRLALHYVGAQSEGTLTRGFFDHVVFCPNVTYADGTFKGDLNAVAHDANDLSAQKELSEAWTTLVPLYPTNSVHVVPSIQDAINFVRGLRTTDNGERDADVLVAGSLLLVGGVIEVAGLKEVAL